MYAVNKNIFHLPQNVVLGLLKYFTYQDFLNKIRKDDYEWIIDSFNNTPTNKSPVILKMTEVMILSLQLDRIFPPQ